MKEIWEFIPGYPAYKISNLGRLKSRWQNRSCYVGFIQKDIWKIIKLQLRKNDDYLQIALCDGINKPKTIKIHSLVALVFLGPKPQGYCVRHLDGNRLNNRLDNLAYGTYQENENDKKLHGTHHLRITSKLKEEDVINIRQNSENLSHIELAKKYSVSRPTITRIINNTIWKHIL